MSEMLKPCPFCGDGIDTPEIIPQVDGSEAFFLQCGNCGISMIEFTEENLIKAWNTRTDSEEIEKLKSELSEAVEILKRCKSSMLQIKHTLKDDPLEAVTSFLSKHKESDK